MRNKLAIFILSALLLVNVVTSWHSCASPQPVWASYQGESSFMLEVARGNVPGMSHINKFGMNEDIDAANREVIWENGGDYTFLDTAETLSVVSTDVDDDGSPAGNGAQTVEIIGLDANWDDLTEIVTLNGTTVVVTTNAFLRHFRAIVRSAGSTGGNEGVITATSTSTATIQSTIPNSGDIHNQTSMAVFSIKRNAKGYITQYYGSLNALGPGQAADPAADVELVVRPFGEVFQIKHEIGIVREGSNEFNQFFLPFLIIDGKSDIKISAHVTDDDSVISAGFDIIIVDD